MPGVDGTGSANPLDTGADPNSVEASAADFTRMLEQETAPRRSRKPSEPEKEAPRNADPEPDEGQGRGAVPSDDEPRPEPEDDLRDDILDADDEPEGEDADAEDEDAEPDEDEGEGEDDEGDDDEIDPDTKFEVKVDGKTQAVPLKELLAGYSREADYRQKTARLSEERQEVEQFANEVVQQRQHYDAKLTEFGDLVNTFRPSAEDWDALKKNDLNLYVQTKEQWDALDKKIGEAAAERDRIAQEAAQQQARTYNAYVSEQNEKLFEVVPAIKNPEKAKAFRARLFKYGERAGYTAEELAKGLIDHRDILTMYKAARWDELVEARQGNSKSGKKGKGVRRVKAVTPSEQPRRIARKQGGGRNLRDAERRLARTGSLESAGEAFAELIRSDRI